MNIDHTEINNHLEVICQSPDFTSKPRMQKLLTYIVSEYLEGREDTIKGYSIGIDVFEQGDNFDPDHNALVRINMGRLRRLLKFYYLEHGSTDSIRIDIPKGRYIPNITEHKSNTPANTKQSLSSANKESEGSYEIGILVYPLNNVNGGVELDFLTHGIAHELGTALSKFEDINVIRYSNFDGEQKPLNELLESNRNIEFVIEGDLSVFRNKAQLKIRLIEASSQNQIWGESFALNLDNDNLFETQDKLANKIATSVGAEYGHINKYRNAEIEDTKNITLSEQKAVLHFYYYQTVLSEKSHSDMYESLVKSLESKPDSAIIQALMSCVYGNAYSLGFPGSEQAYEKFGELIESAHKKDSENHLIRAILAFKCFMYGEQTRFFNLVDQGLKRVPTSPIKLGTYGMYLCLYGEWEKGIEIINTIKENNIDFPKWLYGASCLYYYRDENYEEALKEANLYQIQHFFWGPMLRASCLGQLGRVEEAKKQVNTLLEWKPDIGEKAEYLISRYVKQDALVADVMEGLRKAGVPISVKSA